jgi:hypothetical protein
VEKGKKPANVKLQITLFPKVNQKLEKMSEELSLPKSSVITMALERFWNNDEFWRGALSIKTLVDEAEKQYEPMKGEYREKD